MNKNYLHLILDFLKHTFSDSRRVMLQNVIGAVAFLVIVTIVYLNMLFKLEITEFIFEGIFWIVIGCLGVTAAVSGFRGFGKDRVKEPEVPMPVDDEAKETTKEDNKDA